MAREAGAVFPGQMGARVFEVFKVASKNVLRRRFIEDDHMVQAFPA